MSRFDERLARDLERIADQATPSTTTAWEAIRHRIDERPEPEMEITMLTPDADHPRPQRRGWIVAAAAAVLSLVAIGGFLLASGSDEDNVAVREEIPDETETGPDQAESDPAPESEPDPVATAERFLEAFVNLDPNLALEMLVDDPTVVLETANDPASLAQWIAHHEATEAVFDVRRCEPAAGDQVRCDVWWGNAWFEGSKFGRVRSTFRLTVDGEQIAEVRYTPDFGNLELPYTRFRTWLSTNYPDEPATMWVERGGTLIGPSLTEEARQLFEVRTPEYIESLAEE